MQFRFCVSAIFRNRRFFRERTQQFDDPLTRAQPNCVDALVGHDFPICDLKAERIHIKSERCIQIFDDDRYVIDRHAGTPLAE